MDFAVKYYIYMILALYKTGRSMNQRINQPSIVKPVSPSAQRGHRVDILPVVMQHANVQQWAWEANIEIYETRH